MSVEEYCLTNPTQSREFSQKIWLDDMKKLSHDDRNFAERLFGVITGGLGSRPYHRTSARVRNQSDRDHIFRIKREDKFWCVLQVSKETLVFHFPDKIDMINPQGRFKASWSTRRQGEGGKREKNIVLSGLLEHWEEFMPTLDAIHSNALNHYESQPDSTLTCMRQFGQPVSGRTPLLLVPSRETFAELLRGNPRCDRCGSGVNLSLAVAPDGAGWKFCCDTCHPTPSPQREEAGNVVPMSVREIVWHRDGGKCVVCGSDVKLQFDHMIPRNRNNGKVSGSNTENNLRLKCQTCNYSKGNKPIP